MNNNATIWASFTRRFLAYLIDGIVFIIIIKLIFPLIETYLAATPEISLPLSVLILNALFAFRDINGQGIGKRIMKIKVISTDFGNGKVRMYQYLLRFIALIFWPLDFWVYWGSGGKERWGDKIGKTKVVLK